MNQKMSKVTTIVLAVVLVLILAVPVVSADMHENTIVDIAVEDGRFNTLVAAVTAAGLADALSGSEWTVFAPTDDAFAKLDLNPSNVASVLSKADLTDILLYHAVEGSVNSNTAKTLVGDVTMANGKLAGLKVFEDNIFMNDDSKVIIPDIVASNGIIHVVDTVILPPWPRAEGEQPSIGGSSDAAVDTSIVDIAVNDGRFDTLVAAVVYTGVADALSGGEWTVFAPTDDAFAKLDLNENNITSAFSKAELTDILLYHALDSKVDAATAAVSTGDITMANGQLAGLKVFEDNLYVNDDAMVIIPDVFAGNGVIHVVDTVILGPWPR